MRSRFWAMLTTMKQRQHYFDKYKDISESANTWVNILSTLFTLASIAGWSILDKLLWLPPIVIILAQLTQALRPIFPYSKRLAALRYLVPEINFLFTSVDHAWLRIDKLSDEEIEEKVVDFEDQWEKLRAKYIDPNPFRSNQRCNRWAERECKNYVKHYYQLTEEVTMDSQKHPAGSQTGKNQQSGVEKNSLREPKYSPPPPPPPKSSEKK